jgi:hypothetical protein
MSDSTITVKHSETCQTVYLTSSYDKSCPRCAVAWKVIQLRRKNLANGAGWNETARAEQVAQTLIAKYGISKAEIIDRLYTSPTNQIARNRRKSSTVLVKSSDVFEEQLDSLES